MAEAEAIRYVVVCGYAGEIKPLAYIDDNRPVGGAITVTAPDPAMKRIISATGYNPQVENWRAPDKFAKSKWAEVSVTETMWSESHLSWTIHCNGCGKQAQMNQATLRAIADELAENLNPHEETVSTPDPDDPTLFEPRHVRQFGALLRRISQLTR
jgi:hypothetical protein